MSESSLAQEIKTTEDVLYLYWDQHRDDTSNDEYASMVRCVRRRLARLRDEEYENRGSHG